MKKSILSLLMLVFAGMTSNLMAQEVRQGAVIEFEKDVHDYGNITYKGNGTYSFVFSNTGTEPLMISNAKGSCGCTVPSWPKEPIAPGASANIDVTYDTKRVGPISKSVTITSNAVNTPVKVIRIKGTVLAMDGPPAPTKPTVTEVEDAREEIAVAADATRDVAEIVPLTKKQQKAKAKELKKRLKKEVKEKKKAAKLALKKEKAARKAEAKKG